MSPKQALDLLVTASRLARMTYQDHAAADRAIRVLQELVRNHENACVPPAPPEDDQAES